MSNESRFLGMVLKLRLGIFNSLVGKLGGCHS
jgi:hypothetical protein